MRHAAQFVAIAAIISALEAGSLGAQVAPLPGPQAGDGASVDALITALYATVSKAKGQQFDWPRMRALFLPGAQLIPATQAADTVVRYTVESFIALVDASWARVAPIGTDRDLGFFERPLATVKEEYGDVAMAFSSYEKGIAAPGAALTKGINSIQFVRSRGRWWIASIAWDEEPSAGPMPARFQSSPRGP